MEFLLESPSRIGGMAVLGGRSESLLRSESPENCSGSSFPPDQLLLSENFRPRPGSRQKFLLRKSGVGMGVKI